MNERFLLVSDDGFVLTVDGECNLKDAKAAMRGSYVAFCSDLTVRNVVGVTGKRWRGKGPLDLFMGSLAWTAAPILGEPSRTYALDELKSAGRETFLRRIGRSGFKKKDYAAAYDQADTFEAVYALFRSPTKYLEARGARSKY